MLVVIVFLLFVGTAGAWDNCSYGTWYNGNVGIGHTASAASRLLVDSSDTNTGDVRIGAKLVNTGAELLLSSGGDGIVNTMLYTTNSRLDFSNNLNQKIMTLCSNRTVGIGTIAPRAKLEIVGNNDYPELLLTGLQTGLSAAIGFETVARRWVAGGDSDPDVFFILDQTQGEYRFIIDDMGRVGIGTISTSAKLNVNGIIKGTDLWINIDGSQQSVRDILEYILEQLEGK